MSVNKGKGPRTNKAEPSSGKVSKTASKGTETDKRGQFVLDEIDHNILKHLMEYPEATWKDLSVVAKLSVNAVKARYKKPAFQKALSDIRAKTLDLIERAQNQAIRRMMKLISSPSERIALEASKYVLNPLLNSAQVELKQFKEIVYKAEFGEGGQIISTKEGIEEAPSSTLELVVNDD